MSTLGVRELEHRLTHYLGRAKRGEEVVVTGSMAGGAPLLDLEDRGEGAPSARGLRGGRSVELVRELLSSSFFSLDCLPSRLVLQCLRLLDLFQFPRGVGLILGLGALGFEYPDSPLGVQSRVTCLL